MASRDCQAPTFEDMMFLTSSSAAQCAPARSGLLLLSTRACISFELTAAADVRPYVWYRGSGLAAEPPVSRQPETCQQTGQSQLRNLRRTRLRQEWD